jgi:hypothetical protein
MRHGVGLDDDYSNNNKDDDDNNNNNNNNNNRLCGLVVRVLGYRFGGPGSIPGTTRKKRYWVWNGVHSAS